MKTVSLYKSESGFTLIELLLGLLIVTISLVGLFIGIEYGELQIRRNLIDRAAILVASGECDYQYYWYYNNGYTLNTNRYDYEVVLDEQDDENVVIGTVSMRVVNDSEVPLGIGINFKTIEIIVSWNEALGWTGTKERTIVVREDLY